MVALTREKDELPKIVVYLSLLRYSHALRLDQLVASLDSARAKVVAKADPNQHSTSIYIKLHSVSSADNSSPYKDMVPIGTR